MTVTTNLHNEHSLVQPMNHPKFGFARNVLIYLRYAILQVCVVFSHASFLKVKNHIAFFGVQGTALKP